MGKTKRIKKNQRKMLPQGCCRTIQPTNIEWKNVEDIESKNVKNLD